MDPTYDYLWKCELNECKRYVPYVINKYNVGPRDSWHNKYAVYGVYYNL